ncbi:MAG: serine--tRNA ligase [Rhodospirillaceae bacterium]|nr:serine--tRNA ligase [Rhodospirillaceae bacterium]|tara:strand:+ start:2232 stop:3518 length:1287 start_codon:yes stop_codon:yes gene_type:complete
MFDLKWIRENPEVLDDSLLRRGLKAVSAEIIKIDAERRLVLTNLQELQSQRNEASKQIGVKLGAGAVEEVEALKSKVIKLKESIQESEHSERQLGVNLQDLLIGLPNILDVSVPNGDTENDNNELRSYGEQRNFHFQPKQHYDIGENLSLMDFQSGSKLSGSRFVVLKGALARMERALAQFMLDVQTTEWGYTEIAPPLLVKEAALYGTGQLPKFSDDLFRTTGDHWLIPTAEVPLTNMVSDSILEEANLPIRFVAHTACFRSEAGAAGKDTRGMIRQHQFYKVELVSVVHPDQSDNELERMTKCAESILRYLELPYRVMLLCSGDTGFAASKTYDIEVWLPGQGAFREISSCSNTLDFQARRMKSRFRPKALNKGSLHVHTLNGSGVAIGRALIAIIENYQCEDGSIMIPEALRPYMGGIEVINANE